MHLNGRRGLLHRDGVGQRIMARKRARISAITGGGAIADVSDYQVRMDPDGTFVGTVNEDFAVEANVGDIFQLGNTSWRILKVERGTVRVANAQGQPPSIPFWLGEGPSRTAELSAEIAELREVVATSLPPVVATPASPLPSTKLSRATGATSGSLGAVIGSYKSAVTRTINRLRPGAGAKLWQHNYYEHVVRNDFGLDRVREYVQMNPERWARDAENPDGDGTDQLEAFVRSLEARERGDAGVATTGEGKRRA